MLTAVVRKIEPYNLQKLDEMRFWKSAYIPALRNWLKINSSLYGLNLSVNSLSSQRLFRGAAQMVVEPGRSRRTPVSSA